MKTAPIQWWTKPFGTVWAPRDTRGSITISPRRTRERRSGASSIHINGLPLFSRACIRASAPRRYASQACTVSGCKYTGLACAAHPDAANASARKVFVFIVVYLKSEALRPSQLNLRHAAFQRQTYWIHCIG